LRNIVFNKIYFNRPIKPKFLPMKFHTFAIQSRFFDQLARPELFQTPNAKRQTPNAKRQTPNAKRQTPNAKRQTPNFKPQTSNLKLPFISTGTESDDLSSAASG
jgi:hypothetical protein